MLRRITSALLCLLLLCGAPSSVSRMLQTLYPTSAHAKPHKPKVFVNFTLVRRIYCITPGENDGVRGTGFVISEDTIMTAAHVIVRTVCIDEGTGKVLTPLYRDEDRDISFLTVNGGIYSQWFKLSCDGFREGKEYSAIGYQYGADLVETHLIATRTFTTNFENRRVTHLRALRGNIYQGMSGGPIVDENGIVIGINTAANHNGIGFSREIRDTVLCDSKRPN